MSKGLTLYTKEQKRAYVLNGIMDQRWTVKEAAVLLRISERQVLRLLRSYRQAGVEALVHGNRGRSPRHATASDVRERVAALAAGPYDGANYAHLADLLREREGLEISRWTVRRLLQAQGIASVRRRRKAKHRSRRERYPQEGMLLQVDGSRHQWLGPEGAWLTIVGGIDDATSTVPYAVFREHEDAQGYLLLLQGVLREKGLPLAVYSDRHSIFIQSAPESLEEQLLGQREPTQVGRALVELGIQRIAANSPQAKGRVERLWQTFQERLVMELRLAGAKTLSEANQVLWAYLPKYNVQFGVPAAVAGSAYRPLPAGLDLAGVLCFKYRRTVASDNTVAFAGKTFQVQPHPKRASYARTTIEVQERLDGRVVVCHQGHVLAITEAPEGPVTLRARTGKRASAAASKGQLGGRVSPGVNAGGQGTGGDGGGPAAEDRRVPAAKSPPQPGPDHPWKKRLLPGRTDKITAPKH